MATMLDVLTSTARLCGAVLLRHHDNPSLAARFKKEIHGAHFSTQADGDSQRTGLHYLRRSREFRDECILAEEQDYDEFVLPDDFTVFDPLDGTSAFYNGLPHFGVTLCTFRSRQPYCGVMYFPVDDALVCAERGKGCYVNGRRVTFDRWNRPIDKTLVGYDVGSWIDPLVVGKLTQRFLGIYSIFSAIAQQRLVLEGHLGAYVNMNIAKVWDAAAGVLAIQEAGGYALCPDGSSLRWNSFGPVNWVTSPSKSVLDEVISITRQDKT